jgi:threonine dehydratase
MVTTRQMRGSPPQIQSRIVAGRIAGSTRPVENGAVDGIVPTPLELASPGLTPGREVWLKREDVHELGAFVSCDRCATFADGLAIRVAIPRAVSELQRAGDRIVQVSEREIVCAVGAYARAGIRAEGAAGAGLAALGQVAADPVVVIVCGSNIDDELHARAIQHPQSFPA